MVIMEKKYLFIVLPLILLLAFGIFAGTVIYQPAMAQKAEGHDQAINKAEEAAHLTKIDQAHTFVGKEKHFIIEGKNDKNESVYVWVPDNKNQKIIYKAINEGITEKQAADVLRDGGEARDVIGIQLAREGDVLLWEVAYMNQDNQYTLSYVDFSNGKIHKTITP